MEEDVVGTDFGTDEGAAGAEGTYEAPETTEGGAESVETDTSEQYPDDPWEELKSKGYDPAKLEKSFTRFTSELESVKSLERELAPYKELKEYLDSNPTALDRIEKALMEPEEGVSEVEVLKRDLTNLQRQIATEKEIESVKKYAAENGFPTVDERAVVQHAISNNLGNLLTAYRDLHFDAIRTAEREKAFDEVKGVQKAKAVTSTSGTTKAARTFTQADIAAMSPEEFQANRAAILEYYSSRRG